MHKHQAKWLAKGCTAMSRTHEPCLISPNLSLGNTFPLLTSIISLWDELCHKVSVSINTMSWVTMWEEKNPRLQIRTCLSKDLWCYSAATMFWSWTEHTMISSPRVHHWATASSVTRNPCLFLPPKPPLSLSPSSTPLYLRFLPESDSTMGMSNSKQSSKKNCYLVSVGIFNINLIWFLLCCFSI